MRADRAAGTEKSAVQVSTCAGTCRPQSRFSHASIVGIVERRKMVVQPPGKKVANRREKSGYNINTAAAPPIDQESEKEDSDDCEIIEIEERKAPQRIIASTGAKSRASDQMVANFLNATRKFTDTLEDMRRQELMQSRRKASRKSLDFDEFHTSSRVRRQETTPPRRLVQMSDKRSIKRAHNAVGSCHSCFRKISS